MATRKKKTDNDEAVVIPLDLEDEAERLEATDAEGLEGLEGPEGPEGPEGRLDLNQLKEMSISQLSEAAKGLGVENPAGMRRQDLIFSILQHQTEAEGLIFGEGVLEVLPEGFGFLRAPEYNYLPGPDDIYVSPS
jgi:transcription termination factor Rho